MRKPKPTPTRPRLAVVASPPLAIGSEVRGFVFLGNRHGKQRWGTKEQLAAERARSREKARALRRLNIDHARERDRMSKRRERAKDPSRSRAANARWRKNHRNQINAINRRCRANNPSLYRQTQRAWHAVARRNPLFRMKYALRARLRAALLRVGGIKNQRTTDVLGCSIDAFRAYLETRFRPGMSWNNYGEWQIDHITPIASAKTESEMLRLSHFSNLQPLWKTENQSKGARILAA
jgi:hypothetical protein